MSEFVEDKTIVRPAFHIYDPTPLDGRNTKTIVNDEFRVLMTKLIFDESLSDNEERVLFAFGKQLQRVPGKRAAKKRDLADRAIAKNEEREVVEV